jgi:CRP-like cAMP-binding protein
MYKTLIYWSQSGSMGDECQVSASMNHSVNELLAELPTDEFRALTEKMQLVSLRKGQTLLEVGTVNSQVFYPVGAIVSMINDMPDGSSVETYMLGKACMVGIGAVGVPSFYRATVRNEGLAYRLSVRHLLEVNGRCPTYASKVNLLVQRMLMQFSQAIYCGKKHSVEKQLVRWILITLDRTLTAKIAITHQELSDLLSFRREAITLALGKFSAQGLLAIGRGEITVLDRRGLEDMSCDCYWIGQSRQRLMHQPA